jgi:hypothetical protein
LGRRLLELVYSGEGIAMQPLRSIKDEQSAILEEVTRHLLNLQELGYGWANVDVLLKILVPDPIELAERTHLGSPATGVYANVTDRTAILQEAVEVADTVRLNYSKKYQQRLNTKTSEMEGNMDWARLEGAVRTVMAIRRLRGDSDVQATDAVATDKEDKQTDS